MVGTLNENYQPQVIEAQQRSVNTSNVREHFQAARGKRDDYSDLPSPTRQSTHRGPAPNNPKAIVNGETFVSGKGILEWYAKDNGKLVLQPEHKIDKKQTYRDWETDRKSVV